MSHFTRVRTKLTDMDMVRRALEDLGHDVTTGTVHGHGGMEVQADLVVRLRDRHEVGFCKAGNAISMVGDYMESINAEKFLNRVSQRYAYLTVVEQTAKQGWQMVTEENQIDGSVRLVLQRWA